MKVVVCIGSSCHIKGSRIVVETIKDLVKENKLDNKVEIAGTFCMGNCQQGVSVKVNDQIHSVTGANVNEFFNDYILAKVK